MQQSQDAESGYLWLIKLLIAGENNQLSGVQDLKWKAKIDNKVKDVTQTKSLTLKSDRPSGNSSKYNSLKDFYRMFSEKKYIFAQSFIGIYIHFGVNMLSTGMSHIQDVICKGRLESHNAVTQIWVSHLSVLMCLGCKQQADRSTSHPLLLCHPMNNFHRALWSLEPLFSIQPWWKTKAGD